MELGLVREIGSKALLAGGLTLLGYWIYNAVKLVLDCLLYTSPSPRDISGSRMPSSA